MLASGALSNIGRGLNDNNALLQGVQVQNLPNQTQKRIKIR